MTTILVNIIQIISNNLSVILRWPFPLAGLQVNRFYAAPGCDI